MSDWNLPDRRLPLSFQVFPPKTDGGMRELCGPGGILEQLYTLKPEYISCTYAPGGIDVGKNLEVMDKILRDGAAAGMTHFTCTGNTREGVLSQLKTYRDRNVDRLLVFRGREKSQRNGTDSFGSSEALIRFIRQNFGDSFRIAVAGTPERAREFLASSGRRNVRRTVVRTLGELAHDDSWDVLCAAKALVEAVWEAQGRLQAKGRGKARVDELVKREMDRRIEGQEDYLSRGALAQIEKAVRRELTARERSGMMEALAAAESLLRDVLTCCEDVPTPLVNADVSEVVERIARGSSTGGVVRALEAVAHAADDIAHNVNPQLAFEAMLLCVKEALAWRPSYR